MRGAGIRLRTDAVPLRADYAQRVSEHDPARLFLPRFVPQWFADVVPVLAIMLPAIGIIASGDHDGDARPSAGFVYLVLAALPLVVRRRWPLEVLAWTITVAIATGYGPAYALPLLFALFNVAAMLGRRTGLAAAALVLLAQLVAINLHNGDLPFEALIARTAATGLALAAGLYVHTRHAYIEGLRDRAARAERERELLASQAVAEERVRIARELHDVVAHTGSRRAAVTIRYGAGGVELSVVDEGRGPSSNGSGGHGLVGMRERVALFGGELAAGPGPHGRGYAVRAILPI